MISAVVLAAGLSLRMGSPKLLLPLGDKTIIEHVVDHVSAADVEEIVVVAGENGLAIRRALSFRTAKVVDNPHYAQGQGTSLAAGVAAVDLQARAILFVNGDQPLVTPALINHLVNGFLHSHALIVTHQAKGPPVLFSAKLRLELMQSSGDAGGRHLLEKYRSEIYTVPFDPGPMLMDVDTKEDYRQMRDLWAGR